MTEPGAPSRRVALQQVLAVGVEHVDVEAGRAAAGHRQPRPHFVGEHEVPQLLRFANVSVITSPRHLEANVVSAGRMEVCGAAMK